MTTRVLLIEDEHKVAEAVREGLEAEGFDVSRERTGEKGFYRACAETFDVILLDVTLPGKNGLEVVRTLRAQGVHTRVLMITARDAVSDRVAGLDNGADDYLVKPFAFAELLARIRALLRRGLPEPVCRQYAGIVLDLLTRTAERSGEPLDLTAREFQVLEYLVRHQGEVVSRESLAHDVWGERERSTSLDNVIDVHINRLRKKVEAGNEHRLINTVRGVGFVFGEQDF